jgi:hypothetical protein
MKDKTITACIFLIILAALPALPAGCQETTEGIFEQPLLITSAGQNAEVQIVAVLAKRAGLNYTLSKQATPAELENIKTLVLVLGASLKGLGAAGLDMNRKRQGPAP